jgi:hypothetical protein
MIAQNSVLRAYCDNVGWLRSGPVTDGADDE